MQRQDIIESLRLSPFYRSLSRAERHSTVEMLEGRCQALGLSTRAQPASGFQQNYQNNQIIGEKEP